MLLMFRCSPDPLDVSTLAMSLLRFTDPTEGKIIIDGIDITSVFS